MKPARYRGLQESTKNYVRDSEGQAAVLLPRDWEESMGSRARHRGCREMVRGVDPFKWPKGTCDAAIGTMGAEYDDASCYPAVWR